MARKREELGPAVEARIVALMRQGVGVDGVTAQLRADGVKASRATIARRMRELTGKVNEARAQAAKPKGTRKTKQKAAVSSVEDEDIDADAEPLPETPEDIPEGASLSELTRLMERCKKALSAAEKDNNLPLVGQMIRVAASLAETIRKSTPPERQDPNDSPDMVEAAKRVRKRWHALAESLVRVANSPLAESIGRLVHRDESIHP